MVHLSTLALLFTVLPLGTSYHNVSPFMNKIMKSKQDSTTSTYADITTTQLPEQIRLTFTADPSQMGVYWVTSNSTGDDYVPTVRYGVGSK